MLALKTWLETTSLSVDEEKFTSPPALPYIIFLESRDVYGSDDQNLLVTRSVSVELYSQRIDPASEKKVEDLLDAKAFSYSKSREWIPTERFFQTVYDFEMTERKD